MKFTLKIRSLKIKIISLAVLILFLAIAVVTSTNIYFYKKYYISTLPDKTLAVGLNNLILFSLIIMLVLFFVSLFITIFFTNRWIIRPILKIRQAANDVTLGKISRKVEINTYDETADLAYAFNKMIEKLDTSIKELELSRIDLSKKVDEKTKELSLEKEKLKNMNFELSQERTAIINMLEDMEEINRNLKAAQTQLIQTAKMASIGQLAAGLAHEINNPLTGVLNNVQLIKMIIEQKGDSFTADGEFKELLDVVEESAMRCKNITQSLLSFSRASKNFIPNLSINEIIEKVVDIVSYELKLQNISVRKELDSKIPHTYGNPQLLQQVFMNLITNARWAIKKKLGDKGGLVTVKTQYDAHKERVDIYVSDTGIGMSSEVLNRIFEPFFTTKDVGEGTGLGLSVIYGIIKEHNGSIEVESKIDEGTTFKICLPISNNEAQGRGGQNTDLKNSDAAK